MPEDMGAISHSNYHIHTPFKKLTNDGFKLIFFNMEASDPMVICLLSFPTLAGNGEPDHKTGLSKRLRE